MGQARNRIRKELQPMSNATAAELQTGLKQEKAITERKRGLYALRWSLKNLYSLFKSQWPLSHFLLYGSWRRG